MGECGLVCFRSRQRLVTDSGEDGNVQGDQKVTQPIFDKLYL
jgi:hypothetical protein